MAALVGVGMLIGGLLFITVPIKKRVAASRLGAGARLGVRALRRRDDRAVHDLAPATAAAAVAATSRGAC